MQPVAAARAARTSSSARTLLALALSSLIPLVLTAPSADAQARQCHSSTTLSGDVDGDRRSDQISISGRPDARYGCRFVLVVRVEKRTYRLRLKEGLLTAPNVNVRIADLSGLARIDRQPGAEILVTLNRSASGGGDGVYTFRRDRLRYMPIAGHNRIDGIFWHNQAGLGGTRADCWKGPATGYVISMSYQSARSRPGQDVTRILYRVRGDRFRVVWVRHYRHTSRRFAEQRSGLFESCRARR